MGDIVWAWMPGLVFTLSALAFVASLTAIQVAYRLDKDQTCAFLSAGLSIGYLILSVDFAAAIYETPASPSMRHYAWTAAAVGTLALIIVSNARYWMLTRPVQRALRHTRGQPK